MLIRQESRSSATPDAIAVRWARGNRVVIWLADSTGALVRYKTVHILKEPLPPTPRVRPTITLDIGDKLALLDFRQPPGMKAALHPVQPALDRMS
jgi:hypothetical protein